MVSVVCGWWGAWVLESALYLCKALDSVVCTYIYIYIYAGTVKDDARVTCKPRLLFADQECVRRRRLGRLVEIRPSGRGGGSKIILRE